MDTRQKRVWSRRRKSQDRPPRHQGRRSKRPRVNCRGRRPLCFLQRNHRLRSSPRGQCRARPRDSPRGHLRCDRGLPIPKRRRPSKRGFAPSAGTCPQKLSKCTAGPNVGHGAAQASPIRLLQASRRRQNAIVATWSRPRTTSRCGPDRRGGGVLRRARAPPVRRPAPPPQRGGRLPLCLRPARAGRHDLRREPLEVRKATLASVVRKARDGLRLNEHLSRLAEAQEPRSACVRREAEEDWGR